MLTDAERAFGRNNRVAHTFFLTGDSMATQGYNLPWIACHLPFDRDYTPRLISDLEELAPVDLPIDPERQFHLLAMVASELGASAIGHAFHGVLAAFTQPHVLVWPEPSRDAAQQYATFFGLGAPMNADHVQLARLAGVCALFPVAFAAELSFSLNESSRFKSLVSAPHRGTPVAEPPEERPWLAWCLEFAEAGDSGALVEARQALSSLLPVGTKPSGAALDRTFDFWRRCKATTGDTSWRAKADAIQPLVGLDVDLSTVYEMSVASAGAVHGDQAPLVDALIALGDRASRPLPAPVFQRLLQQIRDVEPEGARVHLIRSGLTPSNNGCTRGISPTDRRRLTSGSCCARSTPSFRSRRRAGSRSSSVSRRRSIAWVLRRPARLASLQTIEWLERSVVCRISAPGASRRPTCIRRSCRTWRNSGAGRFSTTPPRHRSIRSIRRSGST
jgi:hypothetical protein